MTKKHTSHAHTSSDDSKKKPHSTSHKHASSSHSTHKSGTKHPVTNAKHAHKSEIHEAKLEEKEKITYPISEDEIDDSVLDEDGYVKAGAVRVLKKSSKVNTPYNKEKISEEENKKKVGIVGRKQSHKRGESIQKLRKKVGFSWKRLGRKLVLAGVIFGVIFIVGASIAAAYLLDIWNQTQDVDLNSQPKESSIVYARDGETVLFEFFGEERRDVVEFEDIPENMRLAIIALEDRQYYYNETGIPWRNIAGAALKCIQGSDNTNDCRGGSGLSQQYIKNITKDDEATIQRKIRELFTAIRLNEEKNKEEILALYLNQVPFGRNAYGVQEASRTYFGKDIQDIETHEACLLASLPQKPSTYALAIDARNGEFWEELLFKKDDCLRRMYEEKLRGPDTEEFIKTEEELIELQEIELEFDESEDEYPFPHFRDYVTRELRKFGISEQALFTRGYRITTTIDPDVQAKTEASIAENYDTVIAPYGANNAAAVVLDGPTGEIVAMVGSVDYNNEDIDGQVNVVTSPQQPGSSIKPYVYLTDFLQGFNPGTVVLDAKMDFGGGFEPKNFTDRNNGPVSIRYALQSSLNIPAVKGAFLAAGDTAPESLNTENEVRSIGDTGIQTVIETTEKLGLEYPFRNNCFLSTSIGGCEVTMLSHATALNTIAQEGNRKTATPFISIIDAKTDEDVYKTRQESDSPVYPVIDQVIDARYARQLSNVLSDNESRYPIFCGAAGFRCALAARLDLVDQGWDGEFKVAAKTGTTDEVRDTWTVGYSPYYTVTTWVGNTDNTPMSSRADSSTTAGTIWKQIMVGIHEGKEKRGFSREGLEEVGINPSTGLLGSGRVELMTAEQRQILEEARGRLNSNNYDATKNTIFQNRSVVITRTLQINTLDGLLAVEGKTLPEFIEEKTYVTFVPEFPVGDWKRTAEAYNQSREQPPTEFSEQDQIGEARNKPRITTNVVENAQAPGNIVLQAQATGSNDKTIEMSEIFIDGELVASDNSGQVLYNTRNVEPGERTVLLKATDSFGAVSERRFENVEFSGDDDEGESPQGVTIENPPSTSISNETITLRITSGNDFDGENPTLVLSQGVVRKDCLTEKNGDKYACEVSTSGLIPTLDDESRGLIEFIDNSDEGITTNPLSINLTL